MSRAEFAAVVEVKIALFDERHRRHPTEGAEDLLRRSAANLQGFRQYGTFSVGTEVVYVAQAGFGFSGHGSVNAHGTPALADGTRKRVRARAKRRLRPPRRTME